jgi:thiazole synthase
MIILMRDQVERSGRIAVMVNGTAAAVEPGTTVTQLLNQLGIIPDRVAVEINLAVIDRGAFDETRIQEGDRVEIVSFVGGGHG